jgi:hypothetical protein
MKRSRSELVQLWGKWLKAWRWDLVGTITLPGYLSDTKADRVFARWIADIQKVGGTRTFRWVRIMERSADGYNIHYHILLGGMKVKEQRFPSKWTERLRELDGYGLLQRLDPDQTSVREFLKSLPDCDFAITFWFRGVGSEQNPGEAGHLGLIPEGGARGR